MIEWNGLACWLVEWWPANDSTNWIGHRVRVNARVVSNRFGLSEWLKWIGELEGNSKESVPRTTFCRMNKTDWKWIENPNQSMAEREINNTSLRTERFWSTWWATGKPIGKDKEGGLVVCFNLRMTRRERVDGRRAMMSGQRVENEIEKNVAQWIAHTLNVGIRARWWWKVMAVSRPVRKVATFYESSVRDALFLAGTFLSSYIFDCLFHHQFALVKQFWCCKSTSNLSL